MGENVGRNIYRRSGIINDNVIGFIQNIGAASDLKVDAISTSLTYANGSIC